MSYEYNYICKKCLAWYSAHLGIGYLYPQAYEETIKKTKYGIKTVEKWGRVPYVIKYHLDKDYSLLKHKKHLCSCCKKDMKKIDYLKLDKLTCPECKTLNEPVEIIHWD